ncbi:MAG: hypothetical protein KF787_11615 [Phycisphaeraceae bacterium]|nr:hypothetical protein [Phycisphaerae bacterium]MBX3393282.1 hypothetical protein [Phycisphaeraceae bacterium]
MPSTPRRAVIVALVATCGLATSLFPAVAAPQPETTAAARSPAMAVRDDSLPVRRITLYRSGVASFERRGTVRGDSVVQLRFDADQINDILKSMVILDFGGGQINGVSYASREPLARRLASFGVDISANPSMMQILGQLRGARATVATPEGQTPGTILGIESRLESLGNAHEPIAVPYLNMVTASGMQSISSRSINAVVLDDKELNEELTKALAALAEHRAEKTRTVDLSLSGDGPREVAVAYVTEMPVWKTSYRLVLPDSTPEPSRGKDQPATILQGWAIVENTTDEDWTNVTLSLVSGRPVSFRMDLYEPLFVQRPLIPVPMIAGVAPRLYAGAVPMPGSGGGESVDRDDGVMVDLNERVARRNAPAAKSAPRDRAVMLGREVAESASFSAADMAGYSAAAQGMAVESGEVFQYQIDRPVTVERRRSAMLPILSSPIDSRRLSVYNRADGSQHPMRGVQITNTSDLQLLPGPLSVFDAGAYAGDAQIGHVPPGDKRLLAYAVDLDLSVTTVDSSTSVVQRIRLVKGMIEQTIKQVSTTTYEFANKDLKRPRTLLVEHPRMSGWTLPEATNTPRPVEKTDSLYRYELTLQPGKQAGLAVSQELTTHHSMGVFDLDLNWLVQQHQGGRMSKEAIDAVREAARRRGLLEEANRRIASLENTRREIEQDQGRLRENIRAVERASQLYTRYMTKLTEQEGTLDKLLTDLDTARSDSKRLQKDLEDFIASLNAE